MKNKILALITLLAFIVLFLSIIAMDSVNITIPATGMLVSLAWIWLFAKANAPTEE